MWLLQINPFLLQINQGILQTTGRLLQTKRRIPQTNKKFPQAMQPHTNKTRETPMESGGFLFYSTTLKLMTACISKSVLSSSGFPVKKLAKPFTS